MNLEEREEKFLYLKNKLSVSARYEQLSEECAELIQASLKYLRALGNGNPTPISLNEAYRNIEEEATDVYLCLMVNNIYPSEKELDAKLERWYNRVKEANEND